MPIPGEKRKTEHEQTAAGSSSQQSSKHEVKSADNANTPPPAKRQKQEADEESNYKNKFFLEGMRFSTAIFNHNFDPSKDSIYLPYYAKYQPEEQKLFKDGLNNGAEIIKEAQTKGKECFLEKKNETPELDFAKQSITNTRITDELFFLLYWPAFRIAFFAEKQEWIKQQNEAAKKIGAQLAQRLNDEQQKAMEIDTFASYMEGFWSVMGKAMPLQITALTRPEQKTPNNDVEIQTDKPSNMDMEIQTDKPSNINLEMQIEPENKIKRRDILNLSLTAKALSSTEGEDVNTLLIKLKENWERHYHKSETKGDIRLDTLSFEIINGKKAIRLIVKKYEHFSSPPIKSFLETFDIQDEPYSKWFDEGAKLAKEGGDLPSLDSIFREVKTTDKTRLENLKKAFGNGFKCMEQTLGKTSKEETLKKNELAKAEEARKQQELAKAEEARKLQELAKAEEARTQKIQAATEAKKAAASKFETQADARLAKIKTLWEQVKVKLHAGNLSQSMPEILANEPLSKYISGICDSNSSEVLADGSELLSCFKMAIQTKVESFISLLALNCHLKDHLRDIPFELQMLDSIANAYNSPAAKRFYKDCAGILPAPEPSASGSAVSYGRFGLFPA